MDERKRGFAAMDPERRKLVASEGGKEAHRKGTAHKYTTDSARVSGRKGGLAISKDSQHMAKIGRKGGTNRGRVVSRRRAEERAIEISAQPGVVDPEVATPDRPVIRTGKLAGHDE